MNELIKTIGGRPVKTKSRKKAYWIDQHWQEIQGGGF